MRHGLLPFMAIVASLALSSGCAGVTGKGAWGGATGWPSGAQLRRAAMDAARDPTVWVPVAGAALLSVTDLDEEFSDWASDETPVFGNDAADISDGLRNFTAVAYFASALAAPSKDVGNKARGLASGVAAVALASGVTAGLKHAISRDRPDGGSNSFPSGHSTLAGSFSAMAIDNLNYLDMPGWARLTGVVALHGAAIGTAWARVEAEEHYAADVLVGYAIGRYAARFMSAAFFEHQTTQLSYLPMNGGGALRVSRAIARGSPR